MPRHIATWNLARCVWETTQEALCGHSEPFSETWPSSGMTQSGMASELRRSELHTAGSVSSSWRIDEAGLLWTPVTTPEREQKGGDPHMWPASLKEQIDELAGVPNPRAAETSPAEPELLPTHLRNDPAYRSPQSQAKRAKTGFTDLVSAVSQEPRLVPTPRAGQPTTVSYRADYHTNLEEWAGQHVSGEHDLLPTPAVNDMGDGKTLEEWDLWNSGPTMRDQMHGQPLSIVAQDMSRSQKPKESLRGASAPVGSKRTGAAADQTPLLPTPDAYQGSRGGSQDPAKRQAGGHAVSLADVTEHDLLATPTSAEAHGPGGYGPGHTGGVNLATQVDDLLPTPTSEGHSATRRGNWSGGKDRSDELLLAGIAEQLRTKDELLPTPKASNNENVCSPSYTNLASTLKEEVDPALRLLGDGTSQRSDVGSE